MLTVLGSLWGMGSARRRGRGTLNTPGTLGQPEYV